MSNKHSGGWTMRSSIGARVEWGEFRRDVSWKSIDSSCIQSKLIIIAAFTGKKIEKEMHRKVLYFEMAELMARPYPLSVQCSIVLRLIPSTWRIGVVAASLKLVEFWDPSWEAYLSSKSRTQTSDIVSRRCRAIEWILDVNLEYKLLFSHCWTWFDEFYERPRFEVVRIQKNDERGVELNA
jgi:hypothetical protein